MRKIRIILFTVLSFILIQSGYGQLGGQEYKLRGLEFLQLGETDSAMVYLNQATLMGIADGEVLGGLALAYILKGDAQRALEKAVEARKDRLKPSADGFLAGFLAHEQMGNVRQRNRWMEQGLDEFPGDYLLLYHAGRVIIPFESEEGERYLLKSIHAYPGFAPAHLLLGQNMHRRGENIKAALPLIYYLMLYNDSSESTGIVNVLERLYDTWGESALSVSRFNRASRSFTVDFFPEVLDENDQRNNQKRADWFVNQTIGVMNSLIAAEIYSEDALWVFYTDFFSQVARLQFDKPLAMHTAYSRYPAEVMGWISENTDQYELLANWLLIQ